MKDEVSRLIGVYADRSEGHMKDEISLLIGVMGILLIGVKVYCLL